MMAVAFPGLDPQTLPSAEDVVAALVPLCRPDCTESGRLYDVPSGRFLSFQRPA